MPVGESGARQDQPQPSQPDDAQEKQRSNEEGREVSVKCPELDLSPRKLESVSTAFDVRVPPVRPGIEGRESTRHEQRM
jgi:hypothetical protein